MEYDSANPIINLILPMIILLVIILLLVLSNVALAFCSNFAIVQRKAE